MNELDDNTERARAAREALLGRTVAGRYVLHRLIGHGGMGAVYEAEQVGLGKRVAVKFVDPEYATEPAVVARFAREARAMSAIESAHIVSVLDAGTEEGRPFLVMELLRGEDLGQRLRRERRVPLSEAMHVAAQVLKGLARAHAAGIVHRDLKPDNVFLVRSDTDPLFAKIVDFGVSKIERPRSSTTPLALTGRGTVLGTPFYMSPEQAQAASDVDGRADLYSVGAILFECLSGRPPHPGETYEQVILSICMRDAPDLRAIDPNVPPDVAAFVARALARDRTQRFTSAERMLAALHEIAPAERQRVPLDPPAPQTLLSAGVVRGSDPDPLRASSPSGKTPAAATQLGVAELGSIPSVRAVAAADAPATVPDARPALAHADSGAPDPSPATSPSPAGRRGATVVMTAAVATLTGIGVTLAVIFAMDRKPAEPSLAAPSATPRPTDVATPLDVTSAAAAAAASAGPAASAAEASSSSAPTSVSPPPPRPTARTTARPVVHAPSSSKPLDIQRDLP